MSKFFYNVVSKVTKVKLDELVAKIGVKYFVYWVYVQNSENLAN